MKELLKYAKNLEQDFINPNVTYQSRMDLGVTSLVMGDYDKLKQMLNAAIELLWASLKQPNSSVQADQLK